jgi:hypothetical protein
MTLCFGLYRILVLENVLYVLVYKQSLISASKLIDHGYSVSFHSSVTIRRNRSFICFGSMHGNLFHLNPISHQINNIEIKPTKKKRKTMANDSSLWHLRLGHINPNRILRFIHDHSTKSQKGLSKYITSFILMFVVQ